VCRRPQPGGRPAAPGPLAVVQAFINTHYDLEERPGAELLRSPESLEAWLGGAGLLDDLSEQRGGATSRDRRPLAVDRADLHRALALRDGLRRLAAGSAPDGLDAAAAGAAVEVRRRRDGALRFVPAAGSGVRGALGVLLAITAVAIADGSWSRLKICPGDHCGWAFYDGSRNRSGRWCSMRVCGGRAKARSHYRRARPAA